MFQQVYEDITMSCTRVFEWHKWLKKKVVKNVSSSGKQDWSQHQVRKAKDVLWSLVDYSNDHK